MEHDDRSHAGHGLSAKALQLFRKMQEDKVKADKVTFLNILNSCSNPFALYEGRFIHACAVRSQMEADIAVATALVNMYGKCGSVDDACGMFAKISTPNVISWTAMIAAYAQQGYSKEALQLFAQMRELHVQPNKITFVTILNACASSEALAEGKLIHSWIADRRFESDEVVGTALVSMYGRCGSLEDAHHIFDKLPRKDDVVLWSAMITAYTQFGHAWEALQFFQQMRQQRIIPNKVTFVSLVDACTSLASLPEGKLLHGHIAYHSFESDLVVANALVNMYSRCGSVEDARLVFSKMPEHDVVSWNALIAANAQHGHGKEALQLFKQMQQEGTKPDKITFVTILSACSHAGMVDEGCCYFDLMCREHDIKPIVEHYRCIVDLFGRVGRLEEVENFIRDIPYKPGSLAWLSLLGACRVHGNMVQGKHAADHVLELEPQNASAYVMLSNIHAGVYEWEDAANVR